MVNLTKHDVVTLLGKVYHIAVSGNLSLAADEVRKSLDGDYVAANAYLSELDGTLAAQRRCFMSSIYRDILDLALKNEPPRKE